MPPSNPSLPLFAYGLLQPGELGWLRIRSSVMRTVTGCTTAGRLLERDGLSLLAHGTGSVDGTLLWFDPEHVAEALASIEDLEAHLYEWGACRVLGPDGQQRDANVLRGQSLHGAHDLEEPWSSRTDPMFRQEGLDAVHAIAAGGKDGGAATRSLHLQASYLLLLTMIERYTAIRYGVGEDVWPRFKKLAEEPAFIEGLRRHVTRTDEVRRSDNPQKRAQLDPERPRKSVDYYYAVRSNVTHRGKAGIADVKRLQRCIDELAAIFGDVLRAAFADASEGPVIDHRPFS